VNLPEITEADVEVETTEGVLVFIFKGREFIPSHYDGPLPSHLMLTLYWSITTHLAEVSERWK
jgi:hypothetical protein